MPWRGTTSQGPNLGPSVHALELGTLTAPDRRAALSSSSGPLAFPVRAFLVKHAQGVLLVDSGFSRRQEAALRAWNGKRPAEETLLAALRAAGVQTQDIHLVVNTHFHFDHCGGNYLLPDATVVVQRTLMTDRPDFVAGPFQLLDGDTELAPGVRVIATPGHVPGHQSVVVDTSPGSVVVVGDAVYTAAAYASAEPQPQARDRDAYQRSLRRIKDLDPYLVLFTHDRRVAGRGAPGLAKRPASSVQSDRR